MKRAETRHVGTKNIYPSKYNKRVTSWTQNLTRVHRGGFRIPSDGLEVGRSRFTAQGLSLIAGPSFDVGGWNLYRMGRSCCAKQAIDIKQTGNFNLEIWRTCEATKSRGAWTLIGQASKYMLVIKWRTLVQSADESWTAPDFPRNHCILLNLNWERRDQLIVAVGPPPEKVISSLKECNLLQFSLFPMPLITKAPVGRVSQWDAYELDSGTNKECHKFPIAFLFLVDFTLEKTKGALTLLEPRKSHEEKELWREFTGA